VCVCEGGVTHREVQSQSARCVYVCVGLARIAYVIYIHGVYKVILAGKSPNIRCVQTVLANPTHVCIYVCVCVCVYVCVCVCVCVCVIKPTNRVKGCM